MKKIHSIKFGFTLFELLIVIVIIMILVGLLFPAVQSALRAAEKGKAKTVILSIAAASRAYYTDFGQWPAMIASGTPQYVSTNMFTNAMNTVYLDVSAKDLNSNGQVIDPWKNPYFINFDVNYVNSIANPFSGGVPNPISQGVIVWSDGPDGMSSCPADPNVGTAANDADNITSW